MVHLLHRLYGVVDVPVAA